MIKHTMPLSMAESTEFIGDSKDSEAELKKFVKKFVKIKADKGKELRKKLEELNLMKVKSSDIAKVIDLLPEDAESLNKIFNDVSLDEDETKKILETVGEFR